MLLPETDVQRIEICNIYDWYFLYFITTESMPLLSGPKVSKGIHQSSSQTSLTLNYIRFYSSYK